LSGRPPRMTLFRFMELMVTRRMRVVEVEGRSMEPTLWSGERLFCEAFDRSVSLERGDLVVYGDGDASHGWAIKRLAALPGDEMSIAGFGSGTVPAGCCLVLSDNAKVRFGDSRSTGAVPLGDLICRVVATAGGS
jgi:signal peptidase I